MSSIPHKGSNIFRSCKIQEKPKTLHFHPPRPPPNGNGDCASEKRGSGCVGGDGGVGVVGGCRGEGGEGGGGSAGFCLFEDSLSLLQLLNFSQQQFQGRQNELHIWSPRFGKISPPNPAQFPPPRLIPDVLHFNKKKKKKCGTLTHSWIRRCTPLSPRPLVPPFFSLVHKNIRGALICDLHEQ